MKRELEIIKCELNKDIPSIDRIASLPRNKKMKIVFGKAVIYERESFGEKLKNDLKDFQIGVHTQKPEINIARLISDGEIVKHQDFFEKCAKDYRNLARRLINELAVHLEIEINPDSPLESFNFLKRKAHRPKEDIINDYRFYVHGFHCCFENIKNEQVIEVSLVNGLEFGVLDPFFFTDFIKSTPEYQPLPVEIFEDYSDGVRILEKMEKLGKFEKISGTKRRFDVVVADRDKMEVRINEPTKELRSVQESFFKKNFSRKSDKG